MSDTIRERIIAAIATKLAELATVYSAFESGVQWQTVLRAAMDVSSSLLPAIVVFPRVESSSREYGKQICTMPVEVKGLALLEGLEASVLGEKLLGDIITCMIGIEYTRTFTSGGSYQILPSHTITGATSHATGLVVAVTLSTGSWSAGSAAGTIRFRSKTGTFQAENLDIGTHANAATIAGDATTIQAKDISGGGLVDDIAYAGGGVEEYPQTKDEALVVTATFTFTYQTNIGDPYSQA